jgi:hypothetical protein
MVDENRKFDCTSPSCRTKNSGDIVLRRGGKNSFIIFDWISSDAIGDDYIRCKSGRSVEIVGDDDEKGRALCRILLALDMDCSKARAMEENKQELSSGTTR